jgi:hypothetical protein
MTTATLLGSASVGTFMPTSLAGIAAAVAALELPLIDLQAQLTGALAAAANISIQPPSIDLAAAIEGAIQLPGISIDVSIMASLAASLNLKIGDLELALSLLLALKLAFGTAGVYAWLLEGKVVRMGPDLSAQLSGGIPGLGDPNAEGFGVVLLAQDGGAVAALKTLFAVAGA